MVFSVEEALRLYNKDVMQLREELRESLEMAVEDDEDIACHIVVCEVY